ncbi:integrin alpha-M-like isoform X2 [Stegostoma tigrinum]|uniref:integrin alpha-M-like isoform X2 n=1 Tax=Stegostoma tigrinum TaxID=3053191 RepID=UPI002870A339|nr:integrin alpha-M-like isoform X2 [Stegostoma tigrinum]
MSHTPDRIPLWKFVCPMGNFPEKVSTCNITICFNISLATSGSGGHGPLSALLWYSVRLDGQKQVPRVVFDTEERELGLSWAVTDGHHCYTHELLLSACVNDYLNPVGVHINFSLAALPNGSWADLAPILNEHGARALAQMVPIEINCGEDNVCVDHLHVTFHAEREVLVGAASLLELRVSVSNRGEDSYRASVTFHQPLGLHFRKLHNLQSTRVECASNSSSVDNLTGEFTCNVSHPILQSHALAVFILTFEVGDVNVSEEGLRIRAEAKSENPTGISEDSVHEQTIPVKYAVKLFVSRVSSTRYVTFTERSSEERRIKHVYKVENIGGRAVPINVTVKASEEVAGLVRWMPELTMTFQESSAPRCRDIEGREPSAGREEEGPELSKSKIRSVMLVLENNCRLHLILDGIVRTIGNIPPIDTKLTMESEVYIRLDSRHFVNIVTGMNHRAQSATGVEFQKWYNPLPVILGSTLGGFLLLAVLGFALYKCGFFKRNFKDRLCDGDGACDHPTAEPEGGTTPENCQGMMTAEPPSP